MAAWGIFKQDINIIYLISDARMHFKLLYSIFKYNQQMLDV